ncbi:MAG: glucosamine-6-phosphate deaminase, partial [Lachnospiraceae bacterium]|nr:glucosamine-6-phosphate deaminase [Lachnospiraceae bacterium]
DIDKKNTNVPDGRATDLNRACKQYDDIIESFGSIDIQVLGIGQNGHIGFNEPQNVFSTGTHIVDLTENTREANKRFFNSIDEVPTKAITMGTKHIMQAKVVILVANGKNKARAIKESFYGPVNPMVPASILQYHKECYVFVDEDAASEI